MSDSACEEVATPLASVRRARESASHRENPRRASLPSLVLGFAAIYLIWGSTYLGIKFAIETLPPLLMAGTRFVLAGAFLLSVLLLRGAAFPSLDQWRSAATIGALLFLGGNGLVTVAQQWVDSGVVALVVGTTPMWVLLADILLYGAARPTKAVLLGLALGFAGIAVLVQPSGATPPGYVWGIVATLAAPIFWTVGSLQSRRVQHHLAPFMASAMQMLTGGVMMLVVGFALGESGRLDFGAVSWRSGLAFAYLTVAGSLIAFSAYTWLLGVASPTAVATYAYVNPVVAVILGAWLGGERLGVNTIAATVLVVGAVALVTLGKRR